MPATRLPKRPRWRTFLRGIDLLIPHARNPRLHSEQQVAKLARLLTTYGWTTPLLVDGENGIIAGHGRVLAARKLLHDGVRALPNLADLRQLPCVDGAHFTKAQRLAYMLADNRIAQEATWDPELLAGNLKDLPAARLADLTAFSEEEIKAVTLRWAPTQDVAAHGAHTNAVMPQLKVAVHEREQMAEAKRAIASALAEADIPHVFV